jgi:regulator of sigma E protease
VVQGSGDGKSDEKEPVIDVKPRELPPISPWKKILVSVSGAAGNLLLAVFLAWIIYFSPDAARDQIGTLVGHVETNSPAYAAGLRTGDTIETVNGKAVNTWYDFGVECLLGTGESNAVALTARSGDHLKEIVIPTSENEMGVQAVAGVDKGTLCMVTEVIAGGGAEAAGVKEEDLILRFDGQRVAGPRHFSELVAGAGDRRVELDVMRKGEEVHLSVEPRFSEKYGKTMIGVGFTAAEHGGVPWMQYKKPYMQLKYDAVAIIRILKALVTPKESKQAAQGIGGPVLIVATLWVAIRMSLLNAVGFLRFLNLNLAILNLLPIPVLDGGHIVFSLWEAMTRRKANARFVNVLVNVFAVLLIGVLILLTLRDSPRVWQMYKNLRGEEPEEKAEVKTMNND